MTGCTHGVKNDLILFNKFNGTLCDTNTWKVRKHKLFKNDPCVMQCNEISKAYTIWLQAVPRNMTVARRLEPHL